MKSIKFITFKKIIKSQATVFSYNFQKKIKRDFLNFDDFISKGQFWLDLLQLPIETTLIKVEDLSKFLAKSKILKESIDKGTNTHVNLFRFSFFSMNFVSG